MHQHMRKRNAIKPIKNVIPQKRIVVAEVSGETYSENKKKTKIIKKRSRKMVTNVKIIQQMKRGTLREREAEENV